MLKEIGTLPCTKQITSLRREIPHVKGGTLPLHKTAIMNGENGIPVITWTVLDWLGKNGTKQDCAHVDHKTA